ncbi:MAG: hypothetical protein LBH32_00055 [Dysgonamonadaceae bacterium]|jgi:hypothetical protein|nr:hypothetical protein [Dysgonamonadaceae bacterium]
MKAKTISTINELFAIINEYSDNSFYFRGENKHHGKTACLPARLRSPGSHDDAIESEWIEQKLEELGIGSLYTPVTVDSCEKILTDFFANSYYWSIIKYGEEKFEAIMKHYAPDFKALDRITGNSNAEYYSQSFSSSYLDITSDIMVALHFACSENYFSTVTENIKSLEQEKLDNGYLFVFDLREIDKSEYLKLVSYPSYSYISKEKTTDKLYFQSFDRITHQRGAFLVPKKKKEGNKYTTDYEKLKKEIEKYTHVTITIANTLKKELYDIFGKEQGLEYYFPKICCAFPTENNKVRKAYEELKSIALLEKKE